MAGPAGGRGHSPHHAVGALADVREVGVARPHVEHLPADHLRARARRRRRRHVGCRAAAAASAAKGSTLRGRRSAHAAPPGGTAPLQVQLPTPTGKEQGEYRLGLLERLRPLGPTACLTDGRAGGRREGRAPRRAPGRSQEACTRIGSPPSGGRAARAGGSSEVGAEHCGGSRVTALLGHVRSRGSWRGRRLSRHRRTPRRRDGSYKTEPEETVGAGKAPERGTD